MTDLTKTSAIGPTTSPRVMITQYVADLLVSSRAHPWNSVLEHAEYIRDKAEERIALMHDAAEREATRFECAKLCAVAFGLDE